MGCSISVSESPLRTNRLLFYPSAPISYFPVEFFRSHRLRRKLEAGVVFAIYLLSRKALYF
jgi:hypothetical protein